MNSIHSPVSNFNLNEDSGGWRGLRQQPQAPPSAGAVLRLWRHAEATNASSIFSQRSHVVLAMYVYSKTHENMRIYTHIHRHAHICRYTYIYTHVHICIYTHLKHTSNTCVSRLLNSAYTYRICRAVCVRNPAGSPPPYSCFADQGLIQIIITRDKVRLSKGFMVLN